MITEWGLSPIRRNVGQFGDCPPPKRLYGRDGAPQPLEWGTVPISADEAGAEGVGAFEVAAAQPPAIGFVDGRDVVYALCDSRAAV